LKRFVVQRLFGEQTTSSFRGCPQFHRGQNPESIFWFPSKLKMDSGFIADDAGDAPE
jgi:hypothetical protein